MFGSDTGEAVVVESRAETMDKLKVRRSHRVPTGKKRTTEVQITKVCHLYNYYYNYKCNETGRLLWVSMYASLSALLLLLNQFLF